MPRGVKISPEVASKIIELTFQGKTRVQVMTELGIGKNTVSYYSNPVLLERRKERRRRYNSDPLHKRSKKERMKNYHSDPKRKEKVRDSHRAHYLRVRGKVIRVNKRARPDDICELCSLHTRRLDYHHWDDDHPEQGLWLCMRCHYGAEFVEQGRVKLYLKLKGDFSWDDKGEKEEL